MDFRIRYGIPSSWEDDFGFQKNGRIVVEQDAVTISGPRLLKHNAIFKRVLDWALYLYVGLNLLAKFGSHLFAQQDLHWLQLLSNSSLYLMILLFVLIHLVPIPATLRIQRQNITWISRLGALLSVLVFDETRKQTEKCQFHVADIETARQLEAALHNPVASGEEFAVTFGVSKMKNAFDFTNAGTLRVDEATTSFFGRNERSTNRVHGWLLLLCLIVVVPLPVVLAGIMHPTSNAYLWSILGLLSLTILVLVWLSRIFPRPTTISVPRADLQDIEQDAKSICLILRTAEGPAPIYLLFRSAEEAAQLRTQLSVPASQ